MSSPALVQSVPARHQSPCPAREIIFPTAVPDPQYELICIQPIRNDFFFSSPEPLGLHDMNIHDLRLRNKSTHARGLVILLQWGKEERVLVHARCIQPIRAHLVARYTLKLKQTNLIWLGSKSTGDLLVSIQILNRFYSFFVRFHSILSRI